MIREKTGLYLSQGTIYGGDGHDFLRMNIACPKANVIDGLKRLKSALED
jgi:cystathionine beta-lyase